MSPVKHRREKRAGELVRPHPALGRGDFHRGYLAPPKKKENYSSTGSEALDSEVKYSLGERTRNFLGYCLARSA